MDTNTTQPEASSSSTPPEKYIYAIGTNFDLEADNAFQVHRLKVVKETACYLFVDRPVDPFYRIRIEKDSDLYSWSAKEAIERFIDIKERQIAHDMRHIRSLEKIIAEADKLLERIKNGDTNCVHGGPAREAAGPLPV